MLRRKHKKMRNKRGGRTFMDAFTEGAGTIKKSTLLVKEKAERVGEGTKSGFNAFNAGRTAAINRNITGGEDNFFDPFSTTGSNWLKKNKVEKQFGAYTSDGNNHEIYTRPTNPILQSKKPENKEKFEAIKTVTFGGRRKTRKRKKRAGSYYPEEEKRLEEIIKKIPFHLLEKARSIKDKKKKAKFLGVKVKDLKGIGKMIKRKSDEKTALKAHRQMMKLSNKLTKSLESSHEIITPSYEMREQPLVPPLPAGGRRTRKRKKSRKTRKKRAGRKSKKNKTKRRRR